MNSAIKSLSIALQILNKGGTIYIVSRKKKHHQIDSDPLKKADLVIVFNPLENQNVIRESFRLKIPIIAQTGTNHPIFSYVTYPLPSLCFHVFSTYLLFLYRIEKKRKINKSLILAQNER